MVKKAVAHVHANTPHKDRLILTGLVAILAFTVVNTFVLMSNVVVAESAIQLAGA